MAGIGFELRRLLERDSYLSVLHTYGYAAIIGSGPWILSIAGMLLVSLIGSLSGMATEELLRFLTAVTYLIASSFLLTGLLHLLFTRFIADRLYAEETEQVIPNLLGALLVTTATAGFGALPVALLLLEDSVFYRLLMVCSFVVLCDVWVVTIFINSVRNYRLVLAIFLLGYSVTVAAALVLVKFGFLGLIAGFFLGQTLLLFLALSAVLRAYPLRLRVDFSFLSSSKSFYSLAACGFFYNLAVWGDRIVFWCHPSTSDPVIGPLRVSVIYDFPVFLAYFSIVPGMAVFLMRIETDFARHYEAFYGAIRQGGTLAELRALKWNMVLAVRQGIYEIFRVQGLVVLIFLLASATLLEALGMSKAYRFLLNVELCGVACLVLLLALFNVLLYLDRRRFLLLLTAFFAVANIGLSFLSIQLGPPFYGYGFATSVAATSVIAMAYLSRSLARLEYETFALANA